MTNLIIWSDKRIWYSCVYTPRTNVFFMPVEHISHYLCHEVYAVILTALHLHCYTNFHFGFSASLIWHNEKWTQLKLIHSLLLHRNKSYNDENWPNFFLTCTSMYWRFQRGENKSIGYRLSIVLNRLDGRIFTIWKLLKSENGDMKSAIRNWNGIIFYAFKFRNNFYCFKYKNPERNKLTVFKDT